ncbi:DUF3887 domain-containing protein [Pueribacillus sp. YX66]|uniref:DUF3887 domain-containing protein n=1 Tax=Pueribacillus sp. YX66 TaxID=3229242 RepID=UPI00358D641F
MKRMILMMLSVIALIILVACGGNKVDDATADKFTEKAEEVVTLLNDGNYEDVYAMFNEEMEAGLPVEDMEELTPVIEQSGDFKQIDKASVEEKDGYYIVVLVANYSEEDRVFTISFTENEEIGGLFIQ